MPSSAKSSVNLVFISPVLHWNMWGRAPSRPTRRTSSVPDYFILVGDLVRRALFPDSQVRLVPLQVGRVNDIPVGGCLVGKLDDECGVIGSAGLPVLARFLSLDLERLDPHIFDSGNLGRHLL